MAGKEYLQNLIERNNTASQSWYPMPHIDDMKNMDLKGGVTVIVTCADPRANPAQYLGLNPGECPTIRNAGGRVTPEVLTSLELMSAVMPIGMLVLIHHTDCGGLYVTDDDIRSTLSERNPEHKDGIKDKTWLSYKNIGMDQSIRDDVAKLKAWKFLPKGTAVSGYVIDIKTGQLRNVVEPNFSE